MRLWDRARLEDDFLQLCRVRGPRWIESIIRPLRLPGERITVQQIPLRALAAAVDLFGRRQAGVSLR
jgi:hypothetical protein